MFAKRVGTRSCVLLALSLSVCSAGAEPVLDPNSGHYYELVTNAVSWDEAQTQAAARVFGGSQGHLVTITSEAENAFITTQFRQPVYSVPGPQYWIGGFQPPGSPEPAGGWTWVTGEPWSYSNWSSGQPNNDSSENWVVFYPDGACCGATGTWGDAPNGPSHRTYFLVEYEPSADLIAPTINILQPNTTTTSECTVDLSGTATDNVAVVRVVWTNQTTGESGTCDGTTAWSQPLLRLQRGANQVRATAYDEAGNHAEDTIVVYRISAYPDFDEDGDVDADDMTHFAACVTGPGIPQANPACLDADFDAEGDVDQADFGILQACFSGQNRIAAPECRSPCGNDLAIVIVGDPGNAPDTRYSAAGYGAVSYIYRIGKYEITAAEYCAFLNAVATTDTYNLYQEDMANDSGAILRTGSPGSYHYAVKPGLERRPANFVDWFDTLRFANWMHNGQPTGPQNAATTEDGAYLMTGQSQASARKPGARYFLPSENEWYKAAYYKGGSLNAGYWSYPTRSDTQPNTYAAPSTTDSNSVNCVGSAHVGHTTDVGAYLLAAGPYGTYDQGGNLFEWNQDLYSHALRGGSYASGADYTAAASGLNYSYDYYPWHPGHWSIGFRIAATSETPAGQ